MKKPKPEPTPEPQQTGAPSALKFFEEREAKARQEIIAAEVALAKAVKDLERNPPDKDGVDFDKVVRSCQQQLNFAEERHKTLALSLARFDKQIIPERREGEKMPVAEAKEIFAQLLLCVDLAVEQLIIADAQSSALCTSPETFHVCHAENWRAAKDSAISAAKADGVIPEWML